LPHTIHLHGTNQPNAMDGVPHITQHEVLPGKSFTYRFTAGCARTYWYHCHVQDHVHPLMGLSGMLIIEPNRPHNSFRPSRSGGGPIEPMAKATREQYQGEYSLVYMTSTTASTGFPRPTAIRARSRKRMHRDYDSTQRKPNIFSSTAARSRSRADTPLVVNPDESREAARAQCRRRIRHLHTHGHHPILTDGRWPCRAQGGADHRDTFTVGPGQRVDLALRTGTDGYYAAAPACG